MFPGRRQLDVREMTWQTTELAPVVNSAGKGDNKRRRIDETPLSIANDVVNPRDPQIHITRAVHTVITGRSSIDYIDSRLAVVDTSTHYQQP